MPFADHLRNALAAAGFDLAKTGEQERFRATLAKHGVRVSPQAVSAWITGRYAPKLAHALGICDALSLFDERRTAFLADLAKPEGSIDPGQPGVP